MASRGKRTDAVAASAFNFDMAVIDELSSFKNHQSKRFKAFMKDRPKLKRIVGLTGTPASNGLMDLFAEFKLLDTGERLGRFIVQRSVSQKHIGGEHYSISSSAFLILTARYSLVGRSILKRPSKLPTFSTVMFHVSIMSTVYILLSSI